MARYDARPTYPPIVLDYQGTGHFEIKGQRLTNLGFIYPGRSLDPSALKRATSRRLGLRRTHGPES